MDLSTAANVAQIASILPLTGGIALLWRRHNCHVHRCWRIQWRTYGEHALCRRHHPRAAPAATDIGRRATDSEMRHPDDRARDDADW